MTFDKKRIFECTAVAAAYVVFAKAGHQLSFIPGNVTPVWTPSGITFAAFLILGRKVWPGVFAGAVLSSLLSGGKEFLPFSPLMVVISLVIAGGATLQPYAGYLLYKKKADVSSLFVSSSDFLRFVVLIPIICIISAVIGSLALCLGGIAGWDSFFTTLLTWWAGDTVGIYIIAPLIIAWWPSKVRHSMQYSLAKLLVFYVVFVTISLFTFNLFPLFNTKNISLEFIPVLLLFYAAMNLGIRNITASLLVLDVIAIFSALHGKGAFFIENTWSELIVLQIFITVISVVLTIVAVFVNERAKKDRKIMENEQKYRHLVENIPQRLFIKDRNSAFVSCNRKFARDFGLTPHEMIGKTDFDFFPPFLAEKYIADDKRIINTGKSEEIYEDYELDGQIRHVHTIKTPVKDENGTVTGLLAIFRDITEQVQAERALAESKANLLRAQEVAHVGNWYIDMKNNRLTWSDETYRIFGMDKTSEGLVYESFLRKVHPDDVQAVDAAWKNAIQNMSPYDIEHRVMVNGRLKWVREIADIEFDDDGFAVSGIGIVHDITERKIYELNLKKERDNVQRYLDIAGVIFLILDKFGNVSLINKKGCEILGFDEWEIIGQNWFCKFIPKHASDRCRLEFNSIFETGIAKFKLHDCPVINKDLGERIIKWHNSPIRDEKGELVSLLCSGEDITEKKVVEDALMESEYQLRSLIETAGSLILYISSKYEILEFNSEAERVYGYKKEDVIGKNFLEMFVPENERKAFIKEIISVIQGKKKQQFESVIESRSGYKRYISWNITQMLNSENKLMGVVAVGQNVTVRKKAEEALRENEEKYRMVVEQSNDGILIIQDGLIKYLNFSYANLLGYNIKDLLNTSFIKYVSKNEIPRMLDKYTRRIAGEKVERVYETVVLSKNGAEVHVEINAGLISYQGDPAIMVFIRDLTERKNAQKAMLLAEKSSRLASLGTLAAGISHEINQPLTALKLAVDGMLFWGKNNPEFLRKNLIENLEDISSQAERIDKIVQHMRELAQQKKYLKPTVVDVNSIIKKALSLIKQQLSAHKINLTLTLDDSAPNVLAHETLIEQIIINLTINAMHALDHSGKKSKEIEIVTRTKEQKCKIEVLDNGSGIPEEYLDQIFDPFFSSKAVGEGMGLGLSIIMNIVTGLGGTIIAGNKKEGGAKFTVTLPMSEMNSEEDE